MAKVMSGTKNSMSGKVLGNRSFLAMKGEHLGEDET
jgi:hypothetical protein